MVGTTTSQGAHMRSVAGRSRPATSGNKNVRQRATRVEVKAKMTGIVRRAIKGPYTGT